MIAYGLSVSTAVRVGVYSPVGVESAIAISACGRIVSVGFLKDKSGETVTEDRKRGHSHIARERDLSNRGRKVRRV